MKRRFLSNLLFVFFFLPGFTYACTCTISPKTFCESVGMGSSTEVVARLLVLDSVAYISEDNPYLVNPLRRVVIQELLAGSMIEVDTFFLVENNGITCSGVLYNVEPGDEIIAGFDLSNNGYIPEEAIEELGAPFYELPGCGRFWLPIDAEGNVIGSIEPDVEVMAYADFVAGIDACVALVSSTATAPTLLAEARFSLDGQLLLQMEHSEEADLRLFDAQGRLVHQETTRLPGQQEAFRWSLPALPSGLYLLSVQTPSGRAVVKMVRP